MAEDFFASRRVREAKVFSHRNVAQTRPQCAGRVRRARFCCAAIYLHHSLAPTAFCVRIRRLDWSPGGPLL